MIEFLAYSSAPFVLFIFVALVNCLLVALGSASGMRLQAGKKERSDAAFGVAQTAIFSIAALILAFSFSLAAARFDTRRGLVVDEANAIGTTYLRGAYLPSGEIGRFRSLLGSYTRARLDAYAYNPSMRARLQSESRSLAMQDVLWAIASNAGRTDPRNVQLGLLTQTLNDTIDVSAKQKEALTNHLPSAIVGLMLIVTFAAAFTMGVTFGRENASSWSMAIAFSILFAVVVTAIVALDRPQRGLVRVSLAPLQRQLESMKP